MVSTVNSTTSSAAFVQANVHPIRPRTTPRPRPRPTGLSPAQALQPRAINLISKGTIARADRSDMSMTGPSSTPSINVSSARQSQSKASPQGSSMSTRRGSIMRSGLSTSHVLSVEEQGLSVLNKPFKPIADVVFVHGLQGHPEETWTFTETVTTTESNPTLKEEDRCLRPVWRKKKQLSVFWPRDLLAREQNNLRLMTYGYDSHVAKFDRAVNQNNINGHGRDLLHELSQARIDDPKRKLIFVVHSLGGIIVKEALRQSRNETFRENLRDLYQSTSALIFFGTPHRGSKAAATGEILRRMAAAVKLDTARPILIDLDPDSGSSKLQELQESFSEMIYERNPLIYSFHETQKMSGFDYLIVPSLSAMLCMPRWETCLAINANHVDMVKFKDDRDNGYQKFRGALLECLKPLKKCGAGESKQREDDKSLPEDDRSLPKKDPDFIIRQDILQDLERLLNNCLDGDPGWVKRAVLWGLSGMGKSSIALAFAHSKRLENPELPILWADASSPDRFHEAFSAFAEEQGIEGDDKLNMDMSLRVRDWLENENQSHWLMVIVNADNLGRGRSRQDFDLRRYIPNCKHGSILFTTSTNEAADILAPGPAWVRKVGGLSQQESTELIYRKLKDQNLDPYHVQQLAQHLEYMPFAITQAAIYIREREIELGGYLDQLRQDDGRLEKLLSKSRPGLGDESERLRPVAQNWLSSATWMKENKPLAYQLLCLMSFFHHQEIPRSFLHHYYAQERGQEQDFYGLDTHQIEINEALEVLRGFSFVSDDVTGYSWTEDPVSMPRLVQLAIRGSLQHEKRFKRWAYSALSTVADLYPAAMPLAVEVNPLDLRHSRAVLKHVTSNLVTSEVSKRSLTQTALLLRKTARHHLEQGLYTEAAALQQQGLAIRRKTPNVENREMLKDETQMSLILLYTGRLKEARMLQSDVRKKCLEYKDRDHDRLCADHNLAAIYQAQGHWDMALALQEKLVRKSSDSDWRPEDSFGYWTSLAKTYRSLGRHKEAKMITHKVYWARKEQKHPRMLESKFEMAVSHALEGRFDEAEYLQRQSIQKLENVFPKLRPELLRRNTELSETLRRSGDKKKLEEAKDIASDVAMKWQKICPDRNPDALVNKHQLALICQAQNQWIEAKEHLVAVVDLSKKVLGDESPVTLDRMNTLLLNYRRLGLKDDAKKLDNERKRIMKALAERAQPQSAQMVKPVPTVLFHHSTGNGF